MTMPAYDLTRGAMTGLKVVDLSRVLAGPLCTQMLADHGADVVKIEPPSGDETRGLGPPFDAAGQAAYFGQSTAASAAWRSTSRAPRDARCSKSC